MSRGSVSDEDGKGIFENARVCERERERESAGIRRKKLPGGWLYPQGSFCLHAKNQICLLDPPAADIIGVFECPEGEFCPGVQLGKVLGRSIELSVVLFGVFDGKTVPGSHFLERIGELNSPCLWWNGNAFLNDHRLDSGFSFRRPLGTRFLNFFCFHFING